MRMKQSLVRIEELYVILSFPSIGMQEEEFRLRICCMNMGQPGPLFGS
jgi:hypothetical protein